MTDDRSDAPGDPGRDDDLLTLEEAARALGVDAEGAERLVSEGRLRPRVPGRFTRRSVEWLRRSLAGAPASVGAFTPGVRLGRDEYADLHREQGRLAAALEAAEEEAAALRRKNRVLAERLARQEAVLRDLTDDVRSWSLGLGADLGRAREEAARLAAENEAWKRRAAAARRAMDDPGTPSESA